MLGVVSPLLCILVPGDAGRQPLVVPAKPLLVARVATARLWHVLPVPLDALYAVRVTNRTKAPLLPRGVPAVRVRRCATVQCITCAVSGPVSNFPAFPKRTYHIRQRRSSRRPPRARARQSPRSAALSAPRTRGQRTAHAPRPAARGTVPEKNGLVNGFGIVRRRLGAVLVTSPLTYSCTLHATP